MSDLRKGGFTLVELLVALVLLGIVTAGIYRVLVNNQRTYQAQTQRVDLQQNIRAAATILPAEFRELNAADGDIKGMWADSIQIRSMRQFGVVCVVPVLGGALTNLTMRLRNQFLMGSAGFVVGDSMLVFHEGNENTRNDDGWALARVTAVNPASTCTPGDGTSATQLTVDFAAVVAPVTNVAGAIPQGATVRGFQIVTYKIYQAADGLWYLGVRAPAGGLQPLIGPLNGNTGFRLNYYDVNGAVTAVAANVAQIELIVRGRTAQAIQRPTGGRVTPVDSIITRVALRNNRRF
jgi:prepilin-type N-terminal cleavage/methylation domain-containing protein